VQILAIAVVAALIDVLALFALVRGKSIITAENVTATTE
jgi:hypothetical protein